MAQYLLSVHTAEDPARPAASDEEASRGFEVIAELEADMTSANALVFSGRLTDPSSATVVRANGGSVVTTDGPYVEAKEAIGGFYIVEAEDLDGALRWAERTSAAIGQPIEVRPFFASRQF
jgi:hypothetical protein